MQALRRKIISQLRELRKEAYSGLPSIEYDFIRIMIDYLETKIKENEER